MTAHDISPKLRRKEKFHHIDMGFLNRRLCLGALSPPFRQEFIDRQKPGSDHMTVLANDHLLVTMLLDSCEAAGVPTLMEALTLNELTHMFRSTEKLSACPEIYNSERVCHLVELQFDYGKPVTIAYHTSHVVSSTGKMILADGAEKGRINSIVGLLHNKHNKFEIEPLVIGQPWFDHWRNGKDSNVLMFHGRDFGELLPEDIEEFSRLSDVELQGKEEWLCAMRSLPESKVKQAFADLLSEPSKSDWGGEENDHYSGNVTVDGRRRTAAFLFKGPSDYREMTLDMCGRRADQVHRLVKSGAEISIVQNAHLIGSVVRDTLRYFTIYPGASQRKYCLIDGLATYRILKAYQFL